MSFGLQVFSDSSVAQVDAKYKNIGLSAKITRTSKSELSWQFFTLDVSSFINPIIAVDFPGIIGPEFWPNLDNQFNPGRGSNVARFVTPGTSRKTATFYIFDESNFISDNSHFGLQVYDESQNLISDSNRLFLRVVAMWQGSNYLSNFQSVSVPNRKILPIFSEIGCDRAPGGGPVYQRTLAAITSLGSVQRTTMNYRYQGIAEAIYNMGYHMMVADVTGF